MADTKISALTELTTVADGDLLAIVDDPGGTPTTKKITKANLVTAIPTSAITSGTFADGRIAASNVTQHQASLSIATSQLTGTVGTAQVANDAITYAKIQNVSATDKLLGRSTAGAGDIEEITCTAAGRAILDDADATAQRTTLGAQETLVSGTNIKTINSTSLLGSGDIAIVGFTDELAQDAVGTILVDSSEIDFTYNDTTPSITASIVAGSIDETKLDTSVNASLDLADSSVQGPGSATDNAIATFDGTTGELIQSARVTISDNGDISTSTFGVAGDKYVLVQNPSGGSTSKESLILAEDPADATKTLQISHLNNSWSPSTAVDFANSGFIRAGGAGGLNLEATNGPVRIAAGGFKYYDLTTGGVSTFYGDVNVPDEAYGAGWNGSLEVPTKNALYDKIETLSGGGGGGISEDDAIALACAL